MENKNTKDKQILFDASISYRDSIKNTLCRSVPNFSKTLERWLAETEGVDGTTLHILKEKKKILEEYGVEMKHHDEIIQFSREISQQISELKRNVDKLAEICQKQYEDSKSVTADYRTIRNKKDERKSNEKYARRDESEEDSAETKTKPLKRKHSEPQKIVIDMSDLKDFLSHQAQKKKK